MSWLLTTPPFQRKWLSEGHSLGRRATCNGLNWVVKAWQQLNLVAQLVNKDVFVNLVAGQLSFELETTALNVPLLNGTQTP